jgi:hypothetical protein
VASGWDEGVDMQEVFRVNGWPRSTVRMSRWRRKRLKAARFNGIETGAYTGCVLPEILVVEQRGLGKVINKMVTHQSEILFLGARICSPWSQLKYCVYARILAVASSSRT